MEIVKNIVNNDDEKVFGVVDLALWGLPRITDRSPYDYYSVYAWGKETRYGAWWLGNFNVECESYTRLFYTLDAELLNDVDAIVVVAHSNNNFVKPIKVAKIPVKTIPRRLV